MSTDCVSRKETIHVWDFHVCTLAPMWHLLLIRILDFSDLKLGWNILIGDSVAWITFWGWQELNKNAAVLPGPCCAHSRWCHQPNLGLHFSAMGGNKDTSSIFTYSTSVAWTFDRTRGWGGSGRVTLSIGLCWTAGVSPQWLSLEVRGCLTHKHCVFSSKWHFRRAFPCQFCGTW